MKPIFLIGFMGSGKSTLGRALAKAAGLGFIDLDNYIEKRFHRNVRDLFAQRGESGFRDIERRMLSEVCDFEDVVVACGGGTPCFFDNMERMNKSGLTVMLEASHEKLLGRLKLGRRRRPLIASMSDDELSAFIHKMLDSRKVFYSKAAACFCSDNLDCQSEIDRSVKDFAERFNISLSSNTTTI
ncbi:MAG: shikimate kinase [Paramuribaculum sp.]|nr:shikimate kinase [Paramuribaculum sp.]MDE6323183.1 shikimate kinase [Paramuribaculum sp.]MDE6489130.1 shikimate kinase [Paramuribaculum sp.]